jgi:hypothetical protein
MKKIFTLLLLVGLLQGAQGCASQTPELKSPCVGAEGSPCAKRPINDWWMHA